MSRGTVAFDRLATTIVAVALLVAGVGAIVWWLDVAAALGSSLDLSGVRSTIGQSWWPWAAGVVGALLVLLGLRWMLAHLPDRGVGTLRLPGSSAEGRLSAESSPVANAAAELLEGVPGVRSSSGRVLRERGELVAHLGATIEVDADLRTIAAAADEVARDLAMVLGREDLHCQVQLKVATRSRSLPRVS